MKNESLMKNLIKFLVKPVLAFALPLLVSCNGEEAPQSKPVIDPVVDSRVDSVKTLLENQIQVMSAVLSGEASVSSCARQTDGSYRVSFVDGNYFMARTEAVTPLFTYVQEGTSKYWALRNDEGEDEVFTDASSNRYAVDSQPEFKVADDDSFSLAFEQSQFALGYTLDDAVQAFGLAVHSDVDGTIYAVTLSFGEDKEYTFGIQGYAGVKLRLPDSEDALAEYYVGSGSSVSVVLDIKGGVEYDLRISEGWSASAQEREGVTYVGITAPETAEEASTVLEVVIGGDYTAASAVFSTNPFRSIFASSVNAVVNPYNGVAAYAYGLCPLSEYSEASVRELASGALSSETGNVASAAVCVPFAQILGAELQEDVQYVLWACPEQNVTDGAVYTYEFKKIVSDIVIGKQGFIDADIEVTMENAGALFAGVTMKTADAKENVIFLINNSIYDSLAVAAVPYEYKGKASEFCPLPDQQPVTIEPDAEYVVWLAPAVNGDYEYTEADVIFREFKTTGVVAGGSLRLTADDANTIVAASSITVPVSCEGAAMIYYNCVKVDVDNMPGPDATNEEKYKYAFVDNSGSKSERFDDTDIVVKGLEPKTEYQLYAVAVDENGRYGEVYCKTFETQTLTFDTSITLTVEDVAIKSSYVTLKITSTGDLSEYIYWFGTQKECVNRFGSILTNDISRKMALNPDDFKSGQISQDGTITFDGLIKETSYVLAIMEMGEQNYTKAKVYFVTTLSADLGQIVWAGTDAWNAAKESVKIRWIEGAFEQGFSGMFSSYAFEFSCQTDMTACVVCGSDTYYDDFINVEDAMINIEQAAGERYDNGTPRKNKDGSDLEPGYYKGGEWIPSGGMMNVYDYYVHGIPQFGTLTYFYAGYKIGQEGCWDWDEGCAHYQRAKEKIAEWLTIEKWKNYGSTRGVEGEELEAYAKSYLQAYKPFYEDMEPIIFVNDGSPIKVVTGSAIGVNEKGEVHDRVIVMFKDKQGNYYEPMLFEVPNYFKSQN